MKRFIDIIISASALLVLAPVILAVAIMSFVKLGSPVLFRQQRPGLKGRPFIMIKFRTMRNAHDKKGQALPDEQRMTQYGRFLRSSSLDELPELWNILKGEMSLVGPRPLLMQYLPLYTPEQKRRHDMRPGLTGWAQVKGRNALSWEEKFALDLWYIDNQSLFLDIKILCLTLWTIIKRDGISAQGEATMPAFKGSEEDK